MKKFFVYVLKSINFDRYYIGSTGDVEKRLELHNSSHARWTKRFQPWELVYSEEYETRSEAVKRELVLKKQKNTEKFISSIEMKK
jgi:putative endonuclease